MQGEPTRRRGHTIGDIGFAFNNMHYDNNYVNYR
jgi:hypothetical protein